MPDIITDLKTIDIKPIYEWDSPSIVSKVEVTQIATYEDGLKTQNTLIFEENPFRLTNMDWMHKEKFSGEYITKFTFSGKALVKIEPIKPGPIEVTMKEIEEKFGRPVKIVKDN